MKKMIAAMLVVCMAFSLAACVSFTPLRAETASNGEDVSEDVSFKWLPWALCFDWQSLKENGNTPTIDGKPIPIEMDELVAKNYDHAVISSKHDHEWSHDKVSVADLMEQTVNESLVVIELYKNVPGADVDSIRPVIPNGWKGTVREMISNGFCYLSSYRDLGDGSNLTEGSDSEKVIARIVELGKPDVILPYSPAPNATSDDIKGAFALSAGAILVWEYGDAFYAVKILDVYLDNDDIRFRFDGSVYGVGDYRNTDLYEGIGFSAQDFA